MKSEGSPKAKYGSDEQETVIERANMMRAYQRMVENKGAEFIKISVAKTRVTIDLTFYMEK
ncbi:hypothetical protein HZS38_05170 [Xenorhabdus nematophila]|uniref:Uncharacterized protein n=1 Tax=Xenorhabdus nematophila (strain ATCC 19061 / DSM 3370 / CCUG 14189 / LMG 1036 / NCIMB 9965 / AN6) TaxID=406817 RepID=D3VIC6_XENNA|nr:hypothetical protein [Xenorhabdus nematophila]CEE90199.1 hypothetical protein XNA1_1200026 [Xenorhabdus nematophila str. Anatoliense]CEF30726.1 hypothetical protein XNW1_2810033 [Xenorhabdus nematophila str. Websteri]AYA39951.1 hypothetical protein D3790_05255 [Xenorhabdus nematophila]KHD29141.1 hypothetical protein LH67_05155 [Xenorhabdus nematophila]MBA0018584.1 hypothetical protein [Xenorhabdus nematophila]